VRVSVIVVCAAVFLVLSGVVAIQAHAEGDRLSPLWLLHIQNYPGGISNGVRARADLGVLRAQALSAESSGSASPTAALTIPLDNIQINADSTPPLPQDETSVAFNVANPMNAVAAANDFTGDGFWIGFTRDGGRTWTSIFKDPKTSDGNRCFGSDPSVVYSVRDGAFYLATLCFFFTPISEVQVWKSVDGGATWTDSKKAAIAMTNLGSDGSIDRSVFYDKELLAVDNSPTLPNGAANPHYGRLYVTFIKFHIVFPSGRSDFCPVQLAFTDAIPTSKPSRATWTHVAVVPDAPFADKGPSANQWALPVVDDRGGLDIAYALEDCNTGFDRGFFFTRSTNGGNTFSVPVQIDGPGQFVDNPKRNDLLPDKPFRAPVSPSLAFNPVTKSLSFVYQNNVNRATSGADISYQRSRDYGRTWSDAKTISITATGSPAPNDQFFPWIAADERGRLHAIWFDNRNDPDNRLIETFQAFSADDGATWTNFDISTQPWDGSESFFDCGCFIGDYNGLAASSQVIYPVWTDGRNSPGRPMGDTNIFTNVEIGIFLGS